MRLLFGSFGRFFFVICLGLSVVMTVVPVISAHASEHESGGGAEKSKEEGGKEGEKHPDFTYHEMKPFVLPIITDKGLTQQVTIVVSLEVPYDKREEVASMEPKLTDAYLQELYGALGNGQAFMIGKVLNVAAVKEKITKTTYRILKQDEVHDVLLQVVQQQQLN